MEMEDADVPRYSENQIREAFRKYARPDDWDVPVLYVESLINALNGDFD